MRTARLLLFACILGGLLAPLQAAAQTQTQNGNVDVSAVVPGPPPADPPTVDEPQSGHTYDQKNILMRGGCIAGLIVKVFESNQFVGSTVCQNDGQFELHIDLVEGKNDLVTKQYDNLNQPSPSSPTITVYYVPLTSPVQSVTPDTPSSEPVDSSSPDANELKLIIDYDYAVQHVIANQSFHFPVHFTGGSPSYAVAVEWGGDATTLVSRQDANSFDAEHNYHTAGTRIVKVRVTDRDGHEASIEFVVIVSGEAPPILDTPLGRLYVENLLRWPTVVFVAIGIFSGGFVLGSFFLPSEIFHISKLFRK